MHANVPSAITILLQPQEVFFAAGSEQPAHPASALIASLAVVLWPGDAFVVPPLGQVSGHLIPADDVEFGTGPSEVGNNDRLVAQEQTEAAIGGIERFVHDHRVRLD